MTDLTATIARVQSWAMSDDSDEDTDFLVKAAPLLAAECERLRRENLDLTASNAINESGCDRALERLDLSSAVVAGLTAECDRLRERVRVLSEARAALEGKP